MPDQEEVDTIFLREIEDTIMVTDLTAGQEGDMEDIN
jgi:hypothetical protein